jgi:phosphoglycerol transferase MdoB-like AlkP superfamily enzyme
MIENLKNGNLLQHRLSGTLFVLFPVVVVGFSLRIILTMLVWNDVEGGMTLLGSFSWGFLQDLLYAAYASVPVIIYLAVVPNRLFFNRFHRLAMWLFFAFVWWTVLFGAIAELIFWDEFGVRFNFIAVDYLIYTTEVVDNIFESYAVGPILATVALAALTLHWLSSRFAVYQAWQQATTTLTSRVKVATLLLLVPLTATIFVSQHDMPTFENRYASEIAKNGQYSFFAAFRNNELKFDEFYQTANSGLITDRVRNLVVEPDSEFDMGYSSPIRRLVKNGGSESRPNVIQITVESLSAAFLGAYGNGDNLTPNLDQLAKESLFFTNFMATGTRTVRGMESLTLSVPPTPGRSIVKRPDNANLFSIGTVFRAKGYNTSFFYGGRGYFDNMNAFFGGNGFEIHDQASAEEESIEFTNAWGVSDEDLYDWVIDEADEMSAKDEPFYYFVMTTSNHRPYTYPEGRVDIPSHTGRPGAVKYTDFAIAKFLAEARNKPWFDNTIFVIVADHCASSAGRTELPIENYRIPLLVYAPALVEPAKIDTLSSQIDYAPTLFGLMNWSYESEFYGKDILSMNPDDGRALIGTYQSLGLFSGELLTLLKPVEAVEAFHYDRLTGLQIPTDVDDSHRLDTIAFYQSAAEQYDEYRLSSAGTRTLAGL